MDIDIDFPDRKAALALFDTITASRIENNKLVKHNSGVYFQRTPVFAEKNISAIPYTETDKLGLFKIDFLNVGIYDKVKNEAHLNELLAREPVWELLEQDDFSDLLFHVHGHGTILRTMKPKSILQLAAVLAIIRPAKRHLLGKSWDYVYREVWKPSTDGYTFKKSHSISYASAIVVQMNLIIDELLTPVTV